MYKLVKKELVDSISIPIMPIARGVSLSHKVKLSRENREGNRDYYHKEFTYRSRYKDPPRVSTLKLTHSSILTLENKEGGGLEALIINLSNRDLVVKSFKKMLKFLKTFEGEVFIEKDGEFIVNPQLRKSSALAFQPYRNKIITVRARVITYDDTERESEGGVAISLDERSVDPIVMEIETFRTLTKVIKNFDFHVAGLAALTYLQAAEIGNHEIEISQMNLNDFDMDLAPIYMGKKKKEESSTDKLQTRTPQQPAGRHRGWD